MNWLHPRTQIIQLLIDKHSYQSYLEIGVERGDTFLRLNNCPKMVGVDPDPESKATIFLPSDEFFESNTDTFDIIFIDGLHEWQQVIRDIDNSLKILNPGGIILAHDCNPKDAWQARELPTGYQKEKDWIWCGSSWLGLVHFRATRSDLKISVINDDYGIGIIHPGKQELIKFDFTLPYEEMFEIWNKNRKYLSNIIEVEQFMKEYVYV